MWRPGMWVLSRMDAESEDVGAHFPFPESHYEEVWKVIATKFTPFTKLRITRTDARSPLESDPYTQLVKFYRNQDEEYRDEECGN